MANEYTGFLPEYDTTPEEWVQEHIYAWNGGGTTGQQAAWENDLDFQEFVYTSRTPADAADMWPDVAKVYNTLGKALGAVTNPIAGLFGKEPIAPPRSAWKDRATGIPAHEAAWTDYERRAQSFAQDVERVYYQNREELPTDWILAQDPDDLRLLSVPGFEEAAQYIEQAQQFASNRRMFLADYQEQLEERIAAAEEAKKKALLEPHNLGGVLSQWFDVLTGPGESRHVDESLYAVSLNERTAIEKQLMDEMLGFGESTLPEGAPAPPDFPDLAGMTSAQKSEALEGYEREYRQWRVGYETWMAGQSDEELEKMGGMAPVMWTLGKASEAIAGSLSAAIGPIDQISKGAITAWFLEEKAKGIGLDPNNPIPDEVLMREAKLYGYSAYWKLMQEQSPEDYQEYIDMAGGDEVMAFGFFSADAENNDEIQGQLDALFTQTQIERDVTIDEALDDSDYRPESLVLDMLAWYGRAVPMRIATGVAVFVRAFAGGEQFWDKGWKNAWNTLWEEVDEAGRSPARALGIDGTLLGLAVDLTGGIICDPITYFFGPRLKTGMGGVSSATEIPRLMASRGVRRVINDLVKWAKRDSVGTGPFMANAGWLMDVDGAIPFLETVGAVEQKVFTNPWKYGNYGKVSNEVEISTVVGLMDDVQRRVLAEHAANPTLTAWATEHLPTTGIGKPVVVMVERNTGRFFVSGDGASLRDIAAFQAIGSAKIPVAIRVVDALPGRAAGLGTEIGGLLRAGETLQRVRSSQLRSGGLIGDGTSTYLRPEQILPKRLVMGEGIEKIERMATELVEQALRKGAKMPNSAYMLTTYMQCGQLRKMLASTPPGAWLDRYFTKQYTRNVLEASGIGSERQQVDAINRLWHGRDPVSHEHWMNVYTDLKRRWARNEQLRLAKIRTFEPMYAEMEALRTELGTSLGPDRLAVLEKEAAEAVAAHRAARAGAPTEMPGVAPAPVTERLELASTDLATGEMHINEVGIRADWDAGTPYLRGQSGPTSVQKAAVFDEMGVDVDALVRELGTPERYQRFIKLHEEAHKTLHGGRQYPPDLMSPEALAMEREAMEWAIERMGISRVDVGRGAAVQRGLGHTPAEVVGRFNRARTFEEKQQVASQLSDDELIAAYTDLTDNWEMIASRVTHLDLREQDELLRMSLNALDQEMRRRPGINAAIERHLSSTDFLDAANMTREQAFKYYFPGGKLPGPTRILHSGGAGGADTAFEQAASQAGYSVRAHSFFGHKTDSPNIEIHTIEELSSADAALKMANVKLGRKFPTRSPYTNNLLRRNYFQVKDSDQVLAVGWIKNGQVDGGTAWATQMGIDMGKPVYVFDQATGLWHTWDGTAWVPCAKPTISAQFAGIGSRNLTEVGRAEIQSLFTEEKTAAAGAKAEISPDFAGDWASYGTGNMPGFNEEMVRSAEVIREELGLRSLSDDELIQGKLASATETMNGPGISHTEFFGSGAKLVAKDNAYTLELVARIRAGNTGLRQKYIAEVKSRTAKNPALAEDEGYMLSHIPDESMGAAAEDVTVDLNVLEGLPERTPRPATGLSALEEDVAMAEPPWIAEAAAKREAAMARWTAARTRHTEATARLSAIEDALDEARNTMHTMYPPRSVDELQKFYNDMYEDYNRTYIGKSKQREDGTWYGTGKLNPWKPFVDPQTGLVPWQVLKKGQYRTTRSLKQWVRDNIGPTGHMEGQPWGYQGRGAGTGEKEAGHQILNSATIEREATTGGQNPETLLHRLSYTTSSKMLVELPLSPLEMTLASELGGGWYIRASQRLTMYALREVAWMFQRWWKLDKVFRPSTAATVSLDELVRVWQDYGMEGVTRYMKDRAIFMEARAQALLHHGVHARGGLHGSMEARGAPYLSPAKQERIRLLGDYPAMFKRAERQAYEGYGVGYADMNPGDIGYADAARAYGGLLLQDSGFRAFLKGRDAYHDWWFSDANTRLPGSTVVDDSGRFRPFDNWEESYRGWEHFYEDIFLRYAREMEHPKGGWAAGASPVERIKAEMLSLSDRISATGGERIFEIPTWMSEYMGPIRGVRMATPKNWTGGGGRLGTQHVQELFFEKFFMDPTNYRRGFIMQLARDVEIARLRKLFESQKLTIIPDYAVEATLRLRGIHGAGSGPLGSALDDALWNAGYVTEGHIAKLADEAAMQEVQNIMYVWDMGSRGGSQIQSIFPFGKPWADMMGYWGREVLRRPALRGWINDANFMNLGDIANHIADYIPFNPKAAAFVSRLAATDFKIDSIAPGVELPGGIESLDFSPLFFLPTGGENPFASLIPGFGYVPMWALDKWAIGVDPLEDPLEYERRMELLSGIIPSLAYQRPGGLGSLSRLLGGGTTEVAISLLSDVGASWLNAPYYTLSNAIGDISMETGRNRAAAAILSLEGELDHLLTADGIDAFTALVDSLTMRATDSATGLHMVQKALRFIMPVRMTVDYGTDEIYDVWLEAGSKFPELNPNPDVDPITIDDDDEKRQVGADIRRIFFDAPQWKRDLMIYQYPQLAINLISTWKWTELGVAQIPLASRQTYRINATDEGLALHQQYVDSGLVRPVQPEERVMYVVGLIHAARRDVPTHLYSRIIGQFNDHLWNDVVTSETKAHLEEWVNTPFGQLYGFTSARQLWEQWGAMQDDLEEMWARAYGIDPVPGNEEWDDFKKDFYTIPEDEQAHSLDFPGAGNAPVWVYGQPFNIYRLDSETMEMVEALGLEIRPGMMGSELFEQLQTIYADHGGPAGQFTETAYRRYIDERSVTADVAMRQLQDLAFHEYFLNETTPLHRTEVQQQLAGFIVMQDQARRTATDQGIMMPASARKVRQEFMKLAELCAGAPLDFNQVWVDAFEHTFGALDFEEDLPVPPDNVFNENGSMGPYTEQPYILKIIDGDTLRVRRSGSVPVEPIFGMQFNRPAEAPVPEEYSVRLIGVRARETGQEGGLEDTRRLRLALRQAYEQNIPVYLVRDPEIGYTDYYNRQLAWLFIGDEPFYFQDELESAILNGWR